MGAKLDTAYYLSDSVVPPSSLFELWRTGTLHPSPFTLHNSPFGEAADVLQPSYSDPLAINYHLLVIKFYE